jgi:hypothetical protein
MVRESVSRHDLEFNDVLLYIYKIMMPCFTVGMYVAAALSVDTNLDLIIKYRR